MAVLRQLKLTDRLESFPGKLFDECPSLEQLDLSGTGLSSLPSDLGVRLPHLKILFLSACAFTVFPVALANCSALEMVAFRGNSMTTIPEDSLPPRLRWLILTDNNITSLPRSIGQCHRLQKCMLAGNCLRSLPDEMQGCKKLSLLRLSSNRLERLPTWLFEMPELAFLSFAGNPCSEPLRVSENVPLPLVPWSSLQISRALGQGASGIISQATWQGASGSLEVAVKVFKGTLTSDGAPKDEMAAVMVAGQHRNIIDCLGRADGPADSQSGGFEGGLIMQLIPPDYRVLGLSPSMQSCTRDCYPDKLSLPCKTGLVISSGIAAAANHLISKGICHGDLYAHNVLYNDFGHALLGDLGAATVHVGTSVSKAEQLEKLEVLAFAHFLDDVIRLVRKNELTREELFTVEALELLQRSCTCADVLARPRFSDIVDQLDLLIKLDKRSVHTSLDGTLLDHRTRIRVAN